MDVEIRPAYHDLGDRGTSEISQKLDAILAKLDELDSRLTAIEKSTGRMDNHIGFVESIYDRVREPIVALLNWNPLGRAITLPVMD